MATDKNEPVKGEEMSPEANKLFELFQANTRLVAAGASFSAASGQGDIEGMCKASLDTSKAMLDLARLRLPGQNDGPK